jgi:tetratricopeptide (TPR) repeat protein
MRGPATLMPVLLAVIAVIAVMGGVVGIVHPAAAQAQTAPPAAASAGVERARQVFERARRAYNLGQWAEAADGFADAYQLTGDPTLLFNRAQALRQGGRLGEAVNAYRAYLREKPDAANRAEVEQRIQNLEQQLASERVLGSPQAGEDETGPALDLTSPAPGPAASPARRWTWVTLGVTGLLAGSATVAGLTMRSRYHSLQDSCGHAPAGCSEDQIDGLRTRVRLANVLWGLTAASAVATGVSFYLESGGARMMLSWRL